MYLLDHEPITTRRVQILAATATLLVIPATVATVAVPANAATDHGTAVFDQATSDKMELLEAEAQSLSIRSADIAAGSGRDGFVSLTPAAARDLEIAGSWEARYGRSLNQGDYGPIVTVALQYVGVPYIFGAASPGYGFDCSGLTRYVYAQFGVDLPHDSSVQGRMGTSIPADQALPGDLVFMDNAHHVGIYMGDGWMIDAPQPGRTVGVHRVWGPHWFQRMI